MLLTAEGYRDSLRRFRPRAVSRLVEDLTASHQGGWYSVISLHGGGSPEAMKREIWRNYSVGDKVDLVERLLDRGIAAADSPLRRRVSRQPGRCCDAGCDARELHLPPGMSTPPPPA